MNKQLAVIAALSLGLGLGCGKDDKGEKAGKGTKGKNGPSKRVGTPSKAKSAIGGTSSVDPTKLIDTEVAIPFGELKKIKLGMTKAEVAKINPKFVDVMRGHVHEGVTYNAHSGRMMADGDKNLFKVHTLLVSFYAKFKYVPWKDVKAALDAKWGPSIEHADFNIKGATSHFWFNPKAGIRAMLNGFDEKRARMGFSAKVKFQQYMPLDKWLGAPGKPFPFLVDGKPLLGMTAADVKKVYDYEPKAKSASSLPYILRTEWDGDQPPSVMVFVGDDGKVNRYSVSLKYKDHPKGAAPVIAAINAKYPGKKLEADNKWAQVGPNAWVQHSPGWKAYNIRIGEKP